MWNVETVFSTSAGSFRFLLAPVAKLKPLLYRNIMEKLLKFSLKAVRRKGF
jgi:hypothetical protein